MNLKSVYLSLISISLVILPNIFLKGQEIKKLKLQWTDPIKYGLEGEEKYNIIHFESAQYDLNNSKLPYYYSSIREARGRELSSVEVLNPIYEELSAAERELIPNVEEVPQLLDVSLDNTVIRKEIVPFIRFTPIVRSSGGRIEKLVSADLKLYFNNSGRSKRLSQNKSLNFANQSLLAQGEWFKIAVLSDGVKKLTYSFLSRLGMDVSNIDPRNISLYGYGGGMLPSGNWVDRPDDLVQHPIQVVGENDGVFNRTDYVLFYGEDQVKWNYDSTNNRFRHKLHTYADTTYYFITVDNGIGKRIPKDPTPAQSPNQFVDSYDALAFHEIDATNLISSGEMWVGEAFNDAAPRTFSFNFPQIITSEPASFEIFAVSRAGTTSNFNVSIANQSFSLALGATVLNRYEVGFGRLNRRAFTFNPNSQNLNFNLSYSKPQSVSQGWLNYLNVNVRSRIAIVGDQLVFRDSRSVAPNALTQFTLNSSLPPRVWEISEDFDFREKTLTQQGNSYSFVTSTQEIKEFVAFKEADSIFVLPVGRVENQNLHALGPADLLIITNPLFLNEALDLERIHEQRGLRVHTVTDEQIYNEFSSGAPDIIALRSFVKMFYDRATDTTDMPTNVVLVGDASYDLKDRIKGNTNFILGFQSRNSLEPTSSYVSDDFIALLDDSEGTWPTDPNNLDKIDVGVGRLPVKTREEARGVVGKVRNYFQSSAIGDWRNKIVFIGDDEDGGIHMNQADLLSQIVQNNEKAYNLTKLYLDGFQQVSTSSGPRYPEVNRRINQSVESGALIVNYTGHGGETGWAGERVLDIQSINAWSNSSRLPLFVTATCEFSRFDDPFRTSGGELVLLNPNGGGIALLTTTRLVFSSPNYLLNRTFYQKLFRRKADGSFYSLGELSMMVKNERDNARQINTRNFSLLGDPSIIPAMPNYRVITTEINGNPVDTTITDTLNALSKVQIKGYVADINGNKLNNFNGILYPTVFDKEKDVETLNNDNGAPYRYKTRDNILFRGKASVQQGDFSYEFVVPKDISYSYGQGKISYYTANNDEDGNGFSQDFLIGGSNPDAIADEQGPEIELFMNDESFVYGGITDNNPNLVANLSDAQGINTVGNGIGHDIVAILDGNTEDAVILNDYYEADLDDYTRGTVTFPFKDLSEGKHTITLKAWDVANNSSERTIEFSVVGSKEIEIQNLLNYPNPFTTNTEFIFQHNQPGIPLDIKLEVFTVSGKLVKSFHEVVVNEGFLSRDIRWDGRDDFGDRIGKGVYVYKLKVRSRNGSTTEKYEKLVIL